MTSLRLLGFPQFVAHALASAKSAPLERTIGGVISASRILHAPLTITSRTMTNG